MPCSGKQQRMWLCRNPTFSYWGRCSRDSRFRSFWWALIWQEFCLSKNTELSLPWRISGNLPCWSRDFWLNMWVLQRMRFGNCVRLIRLTLMKPTNGTMDITLTRSDMFTAQILLSRLWSTVSSVITGHRQKPMSRWGFILIWILMAWSRRSLTCWAGRNAVLMRELSRMIWLPWKAGMMCWLYWYILDIWHMMKIPGKSASLMKKCVRSFCGQSGTASAKSWWKLYSFQTSFWMPR